jgi:uncharacterized damage-inducible protein DinB
MNIKLTDMFLAELDREAKGTRRALERVPDGRADFQPHEKSMDLGRLATLVAGMPGWIEMMINLDELDMVPGDKKTRPPVLATSGALLDAHEAAVGKAREALKRTTEDHLDAPWRLLVSGKVVSSAPRHIMIRDTMSHLSHHRGQLTVYLRLLGAPVPAIYGPSADDPRFD